MPRYENKRDLEIEQQIMKKAIGPTGRQWEKLPEDRYFVDFALFTNKLLVGFAEVKRRQVLSSAYPDLMISLHKLMMGERLSLKMKVPFYLIIGWDDVHGMWEMKPGWADRFDTRWGGRVDRSNKADQELVMHIPISEFDLTPR